MGLYHGAIIPGVYTQMSVFLFFGPNFDWKNYDFNLYKRIFYGKNGPSLPDSPPNKKKSADHQLFIDEFQ
jgi:hypothetical protein